MITTTIVQIYWYAATYRTQQKKEEKKDRTKRAMSAKGET
jgi:hypothetical protein